MNRYISLTGVTEEEPYLQQVFAFTEPHFRYCTRTYESLFLLVLRDHDGNLLEKFIIPSSRIRRTPEVDDAIRNAKAKFPEAVDAIMIYKKNPGKPYYGYGKYCCFVELNEAVKAAGLALYDAIELSRDTPLYFSYRQNGTRFL